jgi:glycosyltransferase involved in cell wall biosynthesis
MAARSAPPSGPLSVAFVSPGWPPEAIANGIASYTGTIVQGLRDLGARCHVLTSRPMALIDDPSVRIVEPDTSSFYFRVRRKLDPESWPQKAFCQALAESVRGLHREGGLDLLEMEESYGWAALLASKCPAPIVVRLHGPWFLNGAANGAIEDAEFRKRDRAEGAGLAAAAAVSAPSASVLDEARKHFGLPLENSALIPNPVTVVPASDRWNLAGCDPKRIAFIGRFDRHKGGDLALDAIGTIVKQVPDALLDFVGPDRGCVDDSRHTFSFSQYLEQNLPPAARENVTYHGFLPGSKAAKLRKQALVTIVPSRYETFGIAAAEAMMAGSPVVAAGAGALLELVQDGRNGLVAKPGDADDLAEKVLWLLNNPARAAELGRQAAIDAEQRYAPVVVARQTFEFYQGVLARGL